MRHLLVPVSLYQDDTNTLDYARSIALTSGAKITLLYTGYNKWLGDKFNQKTFQSEELIHLIPEISNTKIARKIGELMESFAFDQIDYELRYAPSRSIYGLIRSCKLYPYDMIVMSTRYTPGLKGYIRRAYISMIISESHTPVLIVPPKAIFSGLENITYAIDLTDYDPAIIQRIKSIASIFDAKLNVVHINNGDDVPVEREKYLFSLEKTIMDTLDYPKVYYRFFDHQDTFGGIKKFIDTSNTQMIAMISRKRFSAKELFSGKSLTRKMANELTVPLLAFNRFNIGQAV